MRTIKFNNIMKTDRNIKNRIMTSIMNNMETGDFILGKAVKQFEQRFANYIGTKYCVGVSSGTSALEIGMKSLQLETGNIITQSNSYISTALGIIKNNHEARFVDINSKTYMIDETKIEDNIDDNTRALCIVHLYGNSPDMNKILELKQKHNLFLIEDCAQSHGSRFNGIYTGSFGDISCFSFYPSKNLGCYGDGGAICTNNRELYERILHLRNLGTLDNIHFGIVGDNARLDSIQACVLSEKLKMLNNNNNLRREKANLYIDYLKNIDFIELPQISDSVECVWHLFVVKVLYNNRDMLFQYLIDNGIECKIHYAIPIHMQSIFIKENPIHLPQTENVCNQIISLPFHPYMEKAEIKYIADTIKAYTPLTY